MSFHMSYTWKPPLCSLSVATCDHREQFCCPLAQIWSAQLDLGPQTHSVTKDSGLDVEREQQLLYVTSSTYEDEKENQEAGVQKGNSCPRRHRALRIVHFQSGCGLVWAVRNQLCGLECPTHPSAGLLDFFCQRCDINTCA